MQPTSRLFRRCNTTLCLRLECNLKSHLVLNTLIFQSKMGDNRTGKKARDNLKDEGNNENVVINSTYEAPICVVEFYEKINTRILFHLNSIFTTLILKSPYKIETDVPQLKVTSEIQPMSGVSVKINIGFNQEAEEFCTFNLSYPEERINWEEIEFYAKRIAGGDNVSIAVFDLDETLIDYNYKILITKEQLNWFRKNFDFLVLWSHGVRDHVLRGQSNLTATLGVEFDEVICRERNDYGGHKLLSVVTRALSRNYQIKSVTKSLLVDDLSQNSAGDYTVYCKVPSTDIPAFYKKLIDYFERESVF